MKKSILFLFVIFLLQPLNTQASESENQLLFIVKSSSHSLSQSVLKVESENLITSIVDSQTLQKISTVPATDSYLLFENDGMVRVILMDEYGIFYDLLRKEKIQFTSETAKELRNYFTMLHKKHFGEFMDWEEAEQFIPRYSKFKVTDLETGLSFKAERRAGSNHADVQPLTIQDTEIMKIIYDGKWGWKRRSVLIHFNGRILAGSMHGMPHGAGALSNGFPGHFCIHFKGSTTHTSKKEDLSHQVMVNKAGGALYQFVKRLPAEDVVKLFFIAINQHDLDLLTLIFNGDLKELSTIINNVDTIRIIDQGLPISNESLMYEAEVKYIVNHVGKGETSESFKFRALRESPISEWKLDGVPFYLNEQQN